MEASRSRSGVSRARWSSIRFTVCGALAALLPGCNALLNFETAQCQQTTDCRALGPQFAEAACVAGTCVAQSVTTGSQSGDNEGESGGASGCISNTQCMKDHLDEPYACLTPGGECVPLKTEACPLVFGKPKDDNAVYVGAFLNVPASAPLSQMSTLNVQLAVDEFNGSVGGLPGGALGKLRPLVAVVCRNDAALQEAGATHLLDELHVPAVLSNLPSADQKQFFANHALPQQTFVINPGFADNTLTALSSAGLFWHVIGDIRDVAPSYVPLLARVERFLHNPEPMRVAMLVAKRYAEQSIADTLTPLLTFNGKSVTENGADFMTASVTALADDANADYASVNQALLSFRPHVIIAVTREELVYKILPTVESGWAAAAPDQPRPFYILPTALSGNLDLLSYVAQNESGLTSENKRRRIVGVAPASAEDLSLYDEFLVRFRTAYPQFKNPGGFENFYDAFYLLGNAMFAAGSVPKLTGPDIARGMQRVIADSVQIDVGPTKIADGFSALAAGGSIRINGTMGLSDFDPGLGARRGSGSVYCIQTRSGQLSFAYDVLRQNRATGALDGELPCIPGF